MYKQGDIYYAKLDPIVGHEQKGLRPVVVISGNAFNTNQKLVIVAPLTTRIRGFFGSVLIAPSEHNGLRVSSEVLLSHVRTISTHRFGKRIGKVTTEEVIRMHYKLHLLLTTN